MDNSGFEQLEVSLLEELKVLLPFLTWQTSMEINLPISKNNERYPAVCNISIIGTQKFVCVISHVHSNQPGTFNLKLLVVKDEHSERSSIPVMDLEGYPTPAFLIQSFLYILIQFVFRKGEHLVCQIPSSNIIH